MNNNYHDKKETENENNPEKKDYESPDIASYRPLDIMRKWADNSSDLTF